MKKSQNRKKGFTLIELLVVITIIGILAGIAISSFGGIFGSAGQLAAQDSLLSIHKGLAQKYKGQIKFPKGDTLDEESPAGFAVWFRSRTRNPESGLWYIDEDDKVLLLMEDEEGAGLPSSIPTDVGDLDDDQKNAMAWSIEIPGDDANPKLEQNLRSGPFPVMWTRVIKVMTAHGIQTLHGVETVDMYSSQTVKLNGTKTPKVLMKKACSILPPRMMMIQTQKLRKLPILNRLFQKTGKLS